MKFKFLHMLKIFNFLFSHSFFLSFLFIRKTHDALKMSDFKKISGASCWCCCIMHFIHSLAACEKISGVLFLLDLFIRIIYRMNQLKNDVMEKYIFNELSLKFQWKCAFSSKLIIKRFFAVSYPSFT